MKNKAAGFGAGVVIGILAYAAAPAVVAPVEHIAQPEVPVRVLFAGDLMLDRNVARAAAAGGAAALFSSSTLELFKNADARVLNLEGTITDNPSIALQDHTILRFTFDPRLASKVLKLLGASAVSLANNHALDFGQSGYEATRANLEDAAVPAFGHPLNATSTLSTVLVVRGKPFCLVGYHALFDPDTASVVSEIARLRPECYRVIVFAHWGEEYQPLSNEAQAREGRAFIDAGADLVIGAHPHVVEPVEIYRGHPIFYSLGNFMFDQNFSWATTHGLAVRADFYADKTAFTLVPLSITGEYSQVAEGADKDRVIEAAGGVAEFILP